MRFKRYCCLLLSLVLVFGLLPAKAQATDTHPNTYVNTGDQRTDIIGVARTQVGYYETGNNKTKYGAWYGLQYNPWCAMIISWCAKEAEIPTTVIRKAALAKPFKAGFNIPYYHGSSYTPKVGDIFFTGDFAHTGLVYHVDGMYFYSIEGNSNNDGSSDGNRTLCVRRKIASHYFGVPKYAVGEPLPTPQLHIASQNYYTGQNVLVQWDAVENAKSYSVIVYWNGDIISTEELGDQTAFKYEPQKAGYYLFSISAQFADGKESFSQCVVDVEQSPRMYAQYHANGGVITPVYQYVVANSGGVNFRSNHSTSSKSQGMIPAGTHLIVSELVTSGGYTWGKITYNGKNGWCALSSGLCRRVGYGIDESSIIVEYPDANKGNTYWDIYSEKGKALVDPETFGLSKEYNTFVGWSTTLNGDGHIFGRDETDVKATDLGFETIEADRYVTLYAVWQKLVDAISIQSQPLKTKYYAEEPLDTAGLQIKVQYTDGTQEVLSSGFTVSNFDATQTGDQYVKVSFRDKETTFKVTVDARIQYAVENGSAVITDYAQGDAGIVIIPSQIGGMNVTAIAENAFAGCDNIAAIVLPGSLTRIGANAFDGCSALNTVNFTGSQEQWEAISIDSGNEALLNAALTCDYAVLGDFTGDMKVDNNDVIYLLWHTLFPDSFHVTTTADLNGDGKVTNDDVIALLWHTLFPDRFPLVASRPGDEAPSDEPVEEPEQTPEEKPEQTPEEKPEQIPEEEPEQIPEEKPEQTPENEPEQTPNEDPTNGVQGE